MGRFFKQALLSAVFVVGGAAARAGSYVYTPIVLDTGGTSYIVVDGINEFDAVVGAQTVATMKKNGHGYIDSTRGLIWRNGIATFFGAPAGAAFVSSVGINKFGVVLALDTLADGTPGSFTYNPVSGVYHQLSVPGATSLVGISISNGGNVAGTATIGGSAVTHSFVIANGIAAIFDPPGATTSRPRYVAADGTVVGDAAMAGSFIKSGYVYKNGAFTMLSDPAAEGFDGTAAATSAAYISPRGVVVGDYSIEVRSAGFIYRDGSYTNSNVYNFIPMRTLADGRTFGIADYGNNFVGLVGDAHAYHYLIAPGAFDMGIRDVNSHGDFVGMEWLIDGYHPYIATCPAGQSPCQ